MAKAKRIRFLSFVNDLKVEDDEIIAFQKFCALQKRKQMMMDDSSNPNGYIWSLAYHLKNEEQLNGYMKCMLEYFEHRHNMLPKRFADDSSALLHALEQTAKNCRAVLSRSNSKKNSPWVRDKMLLAILKKTGLDKADE